MEKYKEKIYRQLMWDYNISPDEIDKLVKSEAEFAGHYDIEKLYLLQDKFLIFWKTLKLPFYLTGGTALGRFYLNHRYSEDLVFFVNQDEEFNWKTVFFETKEKKQDISHEVLVEFILNYGNDKSVKKLFNLLEINQVADIFYKQTNRQRVNYFPQVTNFFYLYFQKYAHRNSK